MDFTRTKHMPKYSSPITSLRQVANHSASLDDMAVHFRFWLRHVRRCRQGADAKRAIASAPPIMEGKFPLGEVADYWLARNAALLAKQTDLPVPTWAQARLSHLQSFQSDTRTKGCCVRGLIDQRSNIG